jgi:SWI/SNF-related matrix-associated actin-dependent regulator of chromatin subfamily A-like protein 1
VNDSHELNQKTNYSNHINKAALKIISIELQQDKLILKFKADRFLNDILRIFPDALQIKRKNEWQVPLVHAAKLFNQTEFKSLFNYGYKKLFLSPPKEIKARYLEIKQRKQEAFARFVSNPFAVSIEDIELIRPDIQFKLSPDDRLIALVKCNSSVADQIANLRYGFSNSDGTYTISILKLEKLVLFLKETHRTFAFEKSAGERLKNSAILRKNLLTDSKEASVKKLQNALLTPIITIDSKYLSPLVAPSVESLRFNLRSFTDYELQLLFANRKTARQRAVVNQGINFKELVNLLLAIFTYGLSVFLTNDVISILRNYLAEHPESDHFNLKLGFTNLINPCLTLLTDGEVALAVDSKQVEQLREILSLLSRDFDLLVREYSSPLLLDQNSYTYFFIINDQYIDIVEAALEEHFSNFEFSPPYAEFKNKLRAQKLLLTERDYFLNKKDLELSLQNKEVERALFPHQRIAVGWLICRERSLLGDDMGLGKTLSVLATFSELLALNKKFGSTVETPKFNPSYNQEFVNTVDFLLIVAPNSLLRNWQREANNWFKDLKIAILPKNSQERSKLIRDARLTRVYDGIVLNYEALRISSVLEELIDLTASRSVMLCLDESQKVKNYSSQTFKCVTQIADSVKRLVLLSGTPTPKDISDIWTQVFLIDRGERFGKSYFNWLGRVAELGNKYSEVAIRRFIPTRVNQAIRRVQEIMLRRSKEDVIDLPEKFFTTRDVELKGTQLTKYEEIRKDLKLKMTSLNGKVFTRDLDSILEQYLRAVQIASNPRLIDQTWKGDPAKFLELDQIVEELVAERGEKLVVWTNFVNNLSELEHRYSKYSAKSFSGKVSPNDRQQLVNDFQNKDEIKILLAVPAAGGVGITLTRAQTAVYLDKSWNGEHWLQSIDRLHRIGQTGFVNIISLHASKIDRLISANLKRKELAQKKFFQNADSFREDDSLVPTYQELIEAVLS